jgi:hypothetical protein
LPIITSKEALNKKVSNCCVIRRIFSDVSFTRVSKEIPWATQNVVVSGQEVSK